MLNKRRCVRVCENRQLINDSSQIPSFGLIYAPLAHQSTILHFNFPSHPYGTVQLTGHPKLKEWLVSAARANYQELAKLSTEHPELVRCQVSRIQNASHFRYFFFQIEIQRRSCGVLDEWCDLHKFQKYVRQHCLFYLFDIVKQFVRIKLITCARLRNNKLNSISRLNL